MTIYVSVVIPNRNKAESLAHCLEALYRSSYTSFEVIVVDDGSEDTSLEVAGRFPCTLISLPGQVGAAEARNIGARQARGRLLFFIDSDCVVQRDTLALLAATEGVEDPKVIVGGTYTERPFDKGFFSFFQSAFIHYSETRQDPPDYVATHALAIHAEGFRRSGGFARNFLPILEDVDFSHRMRRHGYRLHLNRHLQVRHDFRYGAWRSLANGFNKARHWLVYSLRNKDLCSDSGTASWELKSHLLLFFMAFLSVAAGLFIDDRLLPLPAMFVLLELIVCRSLLKSFCKAGGWWFGLRAAGYFLFCYPLAVWAGAARGLIDAAAQRGRVLFRGVAPAAGSQKDRMTAGPLWEARK